jgi:hypothetical protein
LKHRQAGRRKFLATAEALPREKTADVMIEFVRKRPTYAKLVMKLVNITFTTEEELRRMAAQWMLLAVHPQ